MGSKITVGTPSSGKSSSMTKLVWIRPNSPVVQCAECGCRDMEVARWVYEDKKEFTVVCSCCNQAGSSRKSMKAAIRIWNIQQDSFRAYKELLKSMKSSK